MSPVILRPRRWLDPVECWMVARNLEYVEVEGLEVVVNRLTSQGYYHVAAVVRLLVEEEKKLPVPST